MTFKIIGTLQSASPQISVDPYIPLTLQWPGYLTAPDVVPSIIAGTNGALMEIKTSLEGEILEFVLIESGTITPVSDSMQIPSHNPGVPRIELPLGDSQEMLINAFLDGVEFQFDEAETENYVGIGGVVFGVSSEGLCTSLRVAFQEAEMQVFVE
ncbi:hypothetical protein ACWGCP_03125 [Streptomyces niveus]